MAREGYVERRKRGFFGWIFLLIFLCWNAAMIALVFAAASGVNHVMQDSQGSGVGTALGAGVSFIFILSIWALGAIVTGLLALVTRGGKTVVTRRR